MSEPILLERGGATFATGMARFKDSTGRSGRPADARIYLQVLLGEFSFPLDAMVDTGTPWCIFDPSIDERVLAGLEVVEGPVFLKTHLGKFQGTLYQGSLKILADEGDSLDVDAVMFLCPDWPGGNFIGYLGLLQKIRFAVDPHRNRFYFSAL